VTSLRVLLPLLRQPASKSSLLGGLHSNVRVSKLTLVGGGALLQKLDRETGNVHCKALGILSTSSQLIHVKELQIKVRL
jgi:hypothetical protein